MQKCLKLQDELAKIARSLGVSVEYLVLNTHTYDDDIFDKVVHLTDYIDQLSITTEKKPHLVII